MIGSMTQPPTLDPFGQPWPVGSPLRRECDCRSLPEHRRRNAGWQGRLRQNPQAVVWDLNAHRLLDLDGRDLGSGAGHKDDANEDGERG
jgi:hypothetical protein